MLREMLGTEKYKPDDLQKKDEVGVVNGLAWTSVGGEMLQMEVVGVPGTGKLELTGSLGDVMKESAQTAVTCVRSRAELLGIDMEKTVAIGDYDNDISMFRAAKLGIAVENACDAAKKAADLITVSNEEHAIAQVIYNIENGTYNI